MSLAGARKFIQQALWDRDLIERVNSAPDEASLADLLASLDMQFNYAEFEEACNHLLTQCQRYEQAATIEEIKLWWQCLGNALAPPEP